MNDYQLTLANYKVKFNLYFPCRYNINTISSDMIHEQLLKHYRNYVKNNRMQYSVQYKHEYILIKVNN